MEIGTGSAALLCKTAYRPCCSSANMEVKSQILLGDGVHQDSYHTIVLDLLLEQYVSTATLRVSQQGSFAVTYLMPMEPYNQHMWRYIPVVSEGGMMHILYKVGKHSSVFHSETVHKTI